MPRILYWNINNFTNERITANTNKKRKIDENRAWNSGAAGPDNLALMINTMRPIDPVTGGVAEPDFIIIVEVFARIGGPIEGQLIDSSGLTGCVNLLAEINNQFIGNWSLVPPVVTGAFGQREAIAVFYCDDFWYFLGPETWPAAYPPGLAGCLQHRLIPAGVGYPYRGGLWEDLSAGQWRFRNGPGAMAPLVYFPFLGYRRPWLTAFGQVGAPANLVRIMSLHTTPNDPGGIQYADLGTANLADVWDMTARPPDAANQIDVIVGNSMWTIWLPGTSRQAGPSEGFSVLRAGRGRLLWRLLIRP